MPADRTVRVFVYTPEDKAEADQSMCALAWPMEPLPGSEAPCVVLMSRSVLHVNPKPSSLCT